MADTIIKEEKEETQVTEPARQVYLREGTVFTRWLFGYYDENRLPGWTTPPKWRHVVSTWLPRQRKTIFKEVNLVSIDIDELKEQDGNPVSFHIGISVLRTRDLHEVCHSPRTDVELINIIKSHHWVVEDPQYYQNNDDRFCFGNRRCVQLRDLGDRLRKLIGKRHPSILIVHGGHREITLLQKLELNLNSILTIDTAKAARNPLQVFYDLSLRRLMDELEIPYTGDRLHIAGNDAHFTTRVLLMIAVLDVQREMEGEDIPPWVAVFETIARAPLPPMPLLRLQKAAMKKREKQAAQGKLPIPTRRSQRIKVMAEQGSPDYTAPLPDEALW